MLHRTAFFVCIFTLAFACSQPASDSRGEEEDDCTPSCEVATCGDDGCGGSCGSCDAPETCVEGICTSGTCGNGTLDDDETCDDSAGVPCPTESGCEPLGACFGVTYSGSPSSCDAVCETSQIEQCIDGDGCCPIICNPGNDRDCAPDECGNGQLDPGETCDEPEFECITEADCQPADSCEVATLIGYDFACSLICQRTTINSCGMTSDGCCAPGCTYLTDADCPAPVCGNGVVETGEICDTGISDAENACPSDCNDNRACTTDLLSGSECTAYCTYATQINCIDDDGCCPPTCTTVDDNDCANVTCGDGVIDGDEGCDNAIPAGAPGACPISDLDCDDGDPCTVDTMQGDALDCSARCVNTPMACADGDGCCPYTCTASNDAECGELLACETMCSRAINYCTDANELYATTAECMTACEEMLTGRAADVTGDSVYCRMNHLADALDDPETHCPHGAENPTEGCG